MLASALGGMVMAMGMVLLKYLWTSRVEGGDNCRYAAAF